MNAAALAFLLCCSSPAMADFLGPPVDPEDMVCSIMQGCCEEDCCGAGTSYDGDSTSCVLDPFSKGWDGTYSEWYEFGCKRRACCEEECCAEGTVYNTEIHCCVPGPDIPTVSPTTLTLGPTSTSAPTSGCTVEITEKPCICVGMDHEFEAAGSPAGIYKWSSSDATKAEIIDLSGGTGSMNPLITVRGKAVSAAADDVTITVTYETFGGSTCNDAVQVTVINAELEFKMAGTMTLPENSVGPFPQYGLPTLGPVSPGAPAGCQGFHKNMEITATITPCVELPKCKFDFKREKQGYGGFIDANPVFPAEGSKTFAQAVAEPFNVAGTWDDDDPKPEVDEDLELKVAEGCRLFVIDAPGIRNVGETCTAAEEGDRWYNFKNFREWLNVNNERCTEYEPWYASTYIECVEKPADSGTYVWEEAADFLGVNANDIGMFDETTYQPPPGAAPVPTRRKLEKTSFSLHDDSHSVGLVS